MKKILFLSLCFILASTISAYSQGSKLYTHYQHIDKYDDLIAPAKDMKTIITKTDSTFVIESKGLEPKTFHILREVEEFSVGDKNNVVNIIDNIYGYQEVWLAVKDECVDEASKMLYDLFFGWDRTNEWQKYVHTIVHRVVISQYTGAFEAELFWITDNDGSRQIYGRK